MEQIKCPKCGEVDQFYTELKSNNNVARCSRCDAFIKNIPYQTESIFYFGKYKSSKVSEVDDLSYLEWCIKNVKMASTIRLAVEKRITNLKHLAI